MGEENIYNIQWFPGHMAKTRRMITESLPDVDAVIELRDARIPLSSKNPEIERLCSSKPRIVVLNKSDLCDPDELPLWIEAEKKKGAVCIGVDSSSGKGVSTVGRSVTSACAEKIERNRQKGFSVRIRAMVVGIPNVGKSTLINKLAGSNKAKSENRPGVTRDRQWVKTDYGFDLLDMPGVLWPKFDNKICAENLALTGSVKDDILDLESLSIVLIDRLKSRYYSLLAARYKIPQQQREADAIELFELIARSRGMITRGNEIDYERASRMLIDEFRSGKIGRITLDRLNRCLI